LKKFFIEIGTISYVTTGLIQTAYIHTNKNRALIVKFLSLQAD